MRGVKGQVAAITEAAETEDLARREVGDAVGQRDQPDIIGQGIEAGAVWSRNRRAATSGDNASDPFLVRADGDGHGIAQHVVAVAFRQAFVLRGPNRCLLYTSDAADEEDSVDLGGRRII